MTAYTSSSGQTITLLQVLGRGGEGVVYAVREQPDQVAKIYHAAQRTQ